MQKSKCKSQNYNPSEIEAKWQRIWEKEKIYSPNLDASASLSTKKPFYNLMMFPYPSAEGMHVGNMYAFTGADVYGRFQRMQGKNVFEPIGLDGFGIHSENYAIKAGNHPAKQAEISEKKFYQQLKSIGNGFDWTRTVETYKPEYYKWTQWLFIQLFKAGLAYRKKAPVNFCPSCKTVLADEQVVTKLKVKSEKLKVTEEINVCERCETEVEKKDLEQWFFKITKYADRLLNGLSRIDWAEKVKTAQRLWIGKSEGARIRFKINDFPSRGQVRFKNNKDIEVFTTRPDTLFGATFLVLSPEHLIVASLLKGEFKATRPGLAKLKSYVEETKKKTEQERVAKGKEKTGVFSGLYAINPVNNEKIPVWIADYVLMGYGTGAIMAVPAHDQRDFDFAKKYKLLIKQVIFSLNDQRLDKAYVGEGNIVNSGDWDGWKTPESISKVVDWLEKKGLGEREVNYHLRDWLISRQRYWGPPIPMIYCESCANKGVSWFSEHSENSAIQNVRRSDRSESLNSWSTESSEFSEMSGWFTVPEDQLPVKLPFIEDYKPLGIHSAGSGQAVQAPLASHPEFYKTKCPKCGGEAKRETDVSDTFLDSSWYFLKYLATDRDDIPFPSKFFSEHSESSANQKIRLSEGQKLRQSESSEFSEIEKRLKWLPVAMYIGGAEHSVLHLLYSRFITMALHDLGLISFEEPFTKFRVNGLIVKDGAKMSKSKGNVVMPDEYIKKFGADSLRTYLMFMGPFSQGGDFRDTGIEGMNRFLRRVWILFQCHPELVSGSPASRQASLSTNEMPKQVRHDTESLRVMHRTIKKVTEDISNLSYNTSIAALMEWYNFLNQKSPVPRGGKIKNQKLSKEEIETFLKLLAPFAPHISEEFYQLLSDKKGFSSIHLSSWPKFDPKFLVKEEIIIVVQVNGKLRGNIKVSAKGGSASGGKSEKLKVKSHIEDLAKKDPNVAKHLEAKKIKKVIYVEGKVINFVVE